MTLIITLFAALSLAAAAHGQAPSYADYEYRDVVQAPVRVAAQPRQQPRAQTQAARSYVAVAPAPRYTQQGVAQPPRPTPVPILKQINRHNDDGSYTYGYEGADGSFKIETKLPTGEVMGKYGYVDDTGKLRVIDYGANRYGFQPAGEGITVAPPTLVDETTAKDGKSSFADYDEEAVYATVRPQPRPRRPPTRPEVFAQGPARPLVLPAGFEEQQQQIVRPAPAPAPIYEEAPATFPTAPAPSRFAPPARRPAQPRFVQPQPQPQPHLQQIHFQPTPQPSPVPQRAVVPNAVPLFTPAPSQPPRPAPVREQYPGAASTSGILLDQLVKQYALPAGAGQPLHDITFGSYSSQTQY